MIDQSETRSSPIDGPEAPAVVARGLDLGYGDTAVLEDVSFEVKAGESFAVLGPSGCGKSTLMKALIGLLPVRAGRIEVAGIDVTERDLDPKELHRRLARQIGVLFQRTALDGSRTVAENVALPLEELTDLSPELIRRTVQLTLDLVGLGDHAGARPSELSGGMMRRTGLARAMAFNPHILFCDEPSAGLDPSTARAIDYVLHELNADLGVTLILITHELGSIENLADRCIMLSARSRSIVASGTVEQLRQSDEPTARAFFERQFGQRGSGERKEARP